MRKCRKNMGLTQADVAENMNLSVNYVSDLENGKKNMSTLTLAALCRCFDKSADYFLFGEDAKDSSKIDMNELISFLSTLSDAQLEGIIAYATTLKSLRESLAR